MTLPFPVPLTPLLDLFSSLVMYLQEENPLPSPSLRINVPVLSFSLSVLLVLLGLLALMGLKRKWIAVT